MPVKAQRLEGTLVEKARWKITVNREACVLSGNCVAVAADIFELTDDGARPLHEEISADDAVVDAAEGCPMEAITVLNIEDGTQIAP